MLVARHKQTTYDELNEVIESLQQINAPLLGVVLSDVRVQAGGYSSYEKHRYYRSYNYEYAANKNDKDNH